MPKVSMRTLTIEALTFPVACSTPKENIKPSPKVTQPGYPSMIFVPEIYTPGENPIYKIPAQNSDTSLVLPPKPNLKTEFRFD